MLEAPSTYSANHSVAEAATLSEAELVALLLFQTKNGESRE